MPTRRLRLFLRLAFGITWGVGGLGLLAGSLTEGGPVYWLAGCGPSLAGLAVTWRADGWAGVRQLLGRAVSRRRNLPWYLLVLGYPAAVWAVGGLKPPAVALPALTAAGLLADPGPLGEEFGWRGVALPLLLRRLRPVAAAAVLGGIWAAWHLPTFFVVGLGQSQLSPALFLANTTALSVLLTWLYLRSGGDLGLAVAAHLAANLAAAHVAGSFATLTAINLALATPAAVGLWLSPVESGPPGTPRSV